MRITRFFTLAYSSLMLRNDLSRLTKRSTLEILQGSLIPHFRKKGMDFLSIFTFMVAQGTTSKSNTQCMN